MHSHSVVEHPLPEQLAAFADGGDGLSDADFDAIDQHLQTCATCADALESVASGKLADRIRAANQHSHAALRSFTTHDWLAPLELTTPETPPAPAPAVGPVVPGYEIEGVLGEGGMGVVYKARQVALKRTVALKMILGGKASGSLYRARFKAEAESVARLQHPNIVQIYEVGEADGQPFCALEYVGGGSLSQALRSAKDAWNPRDCAALVATLARAIAHAHAAGIVHRDLKPGNVLLAEGDGRRVAGVKVEDEGADSHHPSSSSPATRHPPPATIAAKIADFGLAKQLDADDFTRSDAIVGTPSYMAPEQASGKAREVGPAADIWALGAILYEMLTGRPPFRGSSVAETLDQVRNQEPVPPRRLAPTCPKDLEIICLKCLHKEVVRRYPSALALGDDLHRFLNGQPINARPVGTGERAWLWCRRKPAIAALSVLAVLTSLVALGLMIRDNIKNRQALDLALFNAQEIGKANAQIQEESKKVEKERNVAIKERSDKEEEAKKAEKSAEERRQALSRSRIIDAARAQQDGDLLASLPWLGEALSLDRNDRVRAPEHRLRLGATLHLSPQLAQMVFHKGQISHVALTPDGTKLLTASWDNTACIWDMASGKLLAKVEHKGPILSAALSPDGQQFATASNDTTVRVWATATGKPLTPPLELDCPAVCVCFSPDGKRVAAGGGNKLRTPATAMRFQIIPQGPGKPDLRIPIPGNDQAEGEALVWDVQTGKTVGPGGTVDGWINHIAFSPDGKHLLAASADHTNAGEFNVWDVQTGKSLFEPAEEFEHRLWHGAFSADGKRFLASGGTEVDDVGETRILDAGGKTLAKLPHKGVVTAAVFSPDGKHVVTASHDHTAALWDAETKRKLANLRHNGEVNGIIYSPSGRHLLTWASDWTGRIWDARTGAAVARVRHSSPVVVAAFSADEKSVVTGDSDGVVRVWRLPAPPESIQTKGPIASVDFSPNGAQMLLGSGQEVAFQIADGGRYSVRRTVMLGQMELHTQGGAAPPVVIQLDNVAQDQFAYDRDQARFSANGKELLILAEREKDLRLQLVVHDTASMAKLLGPFTLEGRILATTQASDGRWLVATSKLIAGKPQQKIAARSEVRLWHLTPDGAKPVSAVLEQPGDVTAATLGEEGKYLVTAATGARGEATQLQRWNVLEAKPEGAPLRLNGSAVALVGDKEGRRVACVVRRDRVEAVRAAEVVFWNAATGKQTTLLHHRDSILNLTFHPQGKWIGTASADRTACVWDFDTGRLVGQPLAHADAVYKIRFSADGNYAASASRDGSARAWVAATGEPLTPPLRHRSAVLAAAFSPDGQCLVTGCADGTAQRWELRPERRTLEELQALLPLQSSVQIDASGNPVPLDTATLQRLWNSRRSK